MKDSNCCGVTIIMSDICSSCKEHCEPQEEEILQRNIGSTIYELVEAEADTGVHACTTCDVRKRGCYMMGTECMLPGNNGKIWREKE